MHRARYHAVVVSSVEQAHDGPEAWPVEELLNTGWTLAGFVPAPAGLRRPPPQAHMQVLGWWLATRDDDDPDPREPRPEPIAIASRLEFERERGYATAEEAALASWAHTPAARARVVAVEPHPESDDAVWVHVQLDSQPGGFHDRDVMTCERGPDGMWREGGSSVGNRS